VKVFKKGYGKLNLVGRGRNSRIVFSVSIFVFVLAIVGAVVFPILTKPFGGYGSCRGREIYS
jgi:hypothetical protein